MTEPTWVPIAQKNRLVDARGVLGEISHYPHGQGWRLRIPGIPHLRPDFVDLARRSGVADPPVLYPGFDQLASYPGVVRSRAKAQTVILAVHAALEAVGLERLTKRDE